MCTCRPISSSPGVAAIRSSSRGASASATPNLASGLPVSIAACVSPGTLGFTRTRTRWPAGARRASRSTSSGPSMTIRPTPASSAATRSASRFALPCSSTCAGSNPADSAIASSPAEATSQPSPSCGEDPHDGSARQRLGGEVHVGRGVARGERGQVLARGRAQAVLVDDEDRGPVLRRDVGERAAADGQAPVGQTPRRPREDAGEAHTEMSRRRIRAAPAAAKASRVGGEQQRGRQLPERVVECRHPGRRGRGAAREPAADRVAGAGDDAEQRLDQEDPAERADDRSDLVAHERADADPERGEQAAGDRAAGDELRRVAAADAGVDVARRQQPKPDGGGERRRRQAQHEAGRERRDELGEHEPRAVGHGEQARRDRAVPELRRDDQDPEHEREDLRDARRCRRSRAPGPRCSRSRRRARRARRSTRRGRARPA